MIMKILKGRSKILCLFLLVDSLLVLDECSEDLIIILPGVWQIAKFENFKSEKLSEEAVKRMGLTEELTPFFIGLDTKVDIIDEEKETDGEVMYSNLFGSPEEAFKFAVSTYGHPHEPAFEWRIFESSFSLPVMVLSRLE